MVPHFFVFPASLESDPPIETSDSRVSKKQKEERKNKMESCTFTKIIHNFSTILSSFPLYVQQKHIHFLSLHIVLGLQHARNGQ